MGSGGQGGTVSIVKRADPRLTHGWHLRLRDEGRRLGSITCQTQLTGRLTQSQVGGKSGKTSSLNNPSSQPDTVDNSDPEV